jgi:hypothetical protein
MRHFRWRQFTTARGADRESGDDLANDGFRSRRDLLRRLVLNRMLDVDRVEIGSSQCAGLRAGRSHKFARGDREGRDPKSLEFHRVVQTARRA